MSYSDKVKPIAVFLGKALLCFITACAVMSYTAYLKEPVWEHTYSGGIRCAFAPNGSPIQCVVLSHPMVKRPDEVRREIRNPEEI